MDGSQPILFSEQELPQRSAYDPQDVRDKLHAFLDKMRAAASWPWKTTTVAHYRQTVWPSLLAKLPDADEVASFRAEIEAEAARLDTAE